VKKEKEMQKRSTGGEVLDVRVSEDWTRRWGRFDVNTKK
jgi:hypothetical protein